MNSKAETCRNLLSGNIFAPLSMSSFSVVNSSAVSNTEIWSPPLSPTATNPTRPISPFPQRCVVRSSSFISCKDLGAFGGALALFGSEHVEVEKSTFNCCSLGDEAETGRKKAGGAILVSGQEDQQVRIWTSMFWENRTERGGALVFVNVTRIQIEDSSFTENEESGHEGRRRQDGRKEERGEGGGVWVCGRVDELLVCGVGSEENRAEGGGWLSVSSLARTSTISSCLFCGNRAERAGGGMLFGGEGDCVSIVRLLVSATPVDISQLERVNSNDCGCDNKRDRQERMWVNIQRFSLSITGNDELSITLTTPVNFITVDLKSSLTLCNLVVHPKGRLLACSVGVVSLSSIAIADNANVFSDSVILQIHISHLTDSPHVDSLTVETLTATFDGLRLDF
ncbi:hypothetical protein BLNAU_7431 [Blattamonas nauphoetae]|uniref:Uncharacterized protein n=1 Tax=Blattamonas nauphoetae TaxID=2049346 RepID=A0ABQ9Y1B0_9EUKA|nr:hypothetical protein BLNAU_7431 [Blattamonas nauphoetae]